MLLVKPELSRIHEANDGGEIMRSMRLIGLVALALIVGTTGWGEEEKNQCPAPVSTCGDSLGALADCPPGFHCTCVPSCPNCRDCAARVCVADPPRECRTACDCEPGLGCFDGQCIAGFAPVFCCEGRQCPAGEQCQHRDGPMDRCGAVCTDQLWSCDIPGGANRACGDDRVCSCTASCPLCEDCGPGVCVPPGLPTPYKCNDDGSCRHPGDRCVCVSSCPECDDCAAHACVPACEDPKDPMCDERQKKVTLVTEAIIERADACRRDEDCTRIDTSTRCAATCGAWVHRRYESRVERYIHRLDERYCATYREDGCTFTTPRCQRQVGACVDGQCTALVPPLTTDGD